MLAWQKEEAFGSEQQVQAPDRIRCANCEHVLCQASDAKEVDGNVEHVFTNPHGHTFMLATFDAVTGATEVGHPGDDWSWFPPHDWQVSLCANCGEHLGWGFSEGSSVLFWGFIVQKIVR